MSAGSLLRVPVHGRRRLAAKDKCQFVSHFSRSICIEKGELDVAVFCGLLQRDVSHMHGSAGVHGTAVDPIVQPDGIVR